MQNWLKLKVWTLILYWSFSVQFFTFHQWTCKTLERVQSWVVLVGKQMWAYLSVDCVTLIGISFTNLQRFQPNHIFMTASDSGSAHLLCTESVRNQLRPAESGIRSQRQIRWSLESRESAGMDGHSPLFPLSGLNVLSASCLSLRSQKHLSLWTGQAFSPSSDHLCFPGKSFHDDIARLGQNSVNLCSLCLNRFSPLSAGLESFSGTSLSRSAHILVAFARHERHVFLMWWKSRKKNASPTPLFQKSKEEKNPPSMLLHSGAPRISPNCRNIWTMLSTWLRGIKSVSHPVIEYLIYSQSPNFTLLIENFFLLLDLNQLSQTG